MARTDPPPSASRVNYAKKHGLPGPGYEYKPWPGAYGTQRCWYCGQRAASIDIIPNLVRNNPLSKLGLRESWLIDCCDVCLHLLADAPAGVSRIKRAYHILLKLRIHQRRARGPRMGTKRILLDRRTINVAARVEGKPHPLI